MACCSGPQSPSSLPSSLGPQSLFPQFSAAMEKTASRHFPPPRHRLVGRGQPTKAARPSLGRQAGPTELPGLLGLCPQLLCTPQPLGQSQVERWVSSSSSEGRPGPPPRANSTPVSPGPFLT